MTDLIQQLEAWADESKELVGQANYSLLVERNAGDMLDLLRPLIEAAEQMRVDAEKSKFHDVLTNGASIGGMTVNYGGVADALADLRAKLGEK